MKLKELPKKYGVIYLGAGRKDTVKKIIEKKNIKNKFKFHENKSLGKYTEVCNPVTQTHAYMIKPSTARHLLDSIKTIELPIDLQWWIYKVDFARLKKALIVQNRIFNSTIQ